jgi:hypothetical protein
MSRGEAEQGDGPGHWSPRTEEVQSVHKVMGTDAPVGGDFGEDLSEE